MDLKLALGSVACLIKYLNLLSVQENHGEYTLSTYNLSNFMKLDASAVEALHLTPGPRDGKSKITKAITQQ